MCENGNLDDGKCKIFPFCAVTCFDSQSMVVSTISKRPRLVLKSWPYYVSEV